MSNIGLENYILNKFKVNLKRSSVGDINVIKEMQKYNSLLGGEQSGHIILGNFATTGDGLMVALEALFSMRKGKKASDLFSIFSPTPQILENVEVKNLNVINSTKCKSAIRKAEKIILGKGRLLVRKSGTEPKIRIMAESYNKNLISKCIKIIKKSILN